MLEFETLLTNATPRITSRQDRLEARLAEAIRNVSPRSTIREIVMQLVDHLRLHGVPASRGVAEITAVATRASSGQMASIPEFPIDVSALVSSWASARYGRAD